MRLKPEGTWKNSDGSKKFTITNRPGESDTYSIEYTYNDKIINGKIHLSNTDNKNWHIVEEIDILGAGIIEFSSRNSIIIRTTLINGEKFTRI